MHSNHQILQHFYSQKKYELLAGYYILVKWKSVPHTTSINKQITWFCWLLFILPIPELPFLWASKGHHEDAISNKTWQIRNKSMNMSLILNQITNYFKCSHLLSVTSKKNQNQPTKPTQNINQPNQRQPKLHNTLIWSWGARKTCTCFASFFLLQISNNDNVEIFSHFPAGGRSCLFIPH